MIFAFLSRYDTCLFISVTIYHTIFQLINTYSMFKSLHHSYCISILFLNRTLKITTFYKKLIEILEETNIKLVIYLIQI